MTTAPSTLPVTGAPDTTERGSSPTGSESTLSCATAAVNETRALGAAVASLAETGDVIVLAGDLGAGKTAFVQGFAAAMGVTAPVTSPTFTLANRYQGRLAVNHLDVYRFEHLDEVRDLAVPELIDDGVTLVEWGETILSELPAERLVIRIGFGHGDDDRTLDFHCRGESWSRRFERLRAAMHACCPSC